MKISLPNDDLTRKRVLSYGEDNFLIGTSEEEKTKLLIIRDLLRLKWDIRFCADKIFIAPPSTYDRNTIKDSMDSRRNEILRKNKKWIKEKITLAQNNLAKGSDALNFEIKPFLEICETQKSLDLFRVYRYFWSSPYSDYVGRRIKFLIRDAGQNHQPVIGIAALGSPIIHIPDRDTWIGWDKETRTKNLIYAMDAFVVGALPPYNALLGGKLISYMLTSNEVREIYKEKYKNVVTNLKKRKASDLVCLFTTGLYGRSAQYNRLKFKGRNLYCHIGSTKGFGSLHLSEETFEAMQILLRSNGIIVTNNFGDGPSWRMRVIRAAGNLLGFDNDFLLNHSFQRSVYAVPLASNCKKFLKGENEEPKYFDYPLEELINFWKARWLAMRLKNVSICERVSKFRPEDFKL